MRRRKKSKAFSASIQKKINHKPKQDVVIILNDWNTEVGNKAYSNIVGIQRKLN